MGERGVCKHLCKASRSVCMHFFVVAAAVGCVRCAFVYAVLHCLRQYCELDFHGDAAAAACASEWWCLCASTPGLRGAGYLSFGRLCARCAREFHMRARARAFKQSNGCAVAVRCRIQARTTSTTTTQLLQRVESCLLCTGSFADCISAASAHFAKATTITDKLRLLKETKQTREVL